MIWDRAGTENPICLLMDIDTLDPLRTTIRGIGALNFIGADIVEVAPAYDTHAELSAMHMDLNLLQSITELEVFINC
ncbi:agmatinase [Penicillium taxi]|uniref:agmatinase n=1 Tax=Penicillium taxi TaxID=168475 RepID=UPI0025455AC1|nr:agmatinase [Penicillium taxi]KAJ5894303.1 agmatinase [Penicillium taxi]